MRGLSDSSPTQYPKHLTSATQAPSGGSATKDEVESPGPYSNSPLEFLKKV